LHPSLRIALYLFSALALPGLSVSGLLLFAAAALLLFHSHLAGARRLIWRARWLFLLLGLGYAYSLPGPVGIPVLAQYSPSLPGLWLGATQMLRLFLLLWLLDGLVVSMGERGLMAGLYGVLSLFRRIGFPVERTTVRLGLTLQAMEGNSGQKRSLREALLNPGVAGDVGHFELSLEPWRGSDTLFLVTALALLIGIWRA
jgi:hypothetical protein